jgi:nucleoside-diphosphate-sugar epimerase
VYTAGAGIQSNVPTSSDAIYQVNAFVPISMIQYLQDQGYQGQVVTFGSYFEIGNSLVQKPYTEAEYLTNDNAVPNNYCISKRLLSQYISQKLPHLPFSLTHLVLPNIYGVGENETRIIPYLVASIEKGTPINLSSGTQQRQFLHVRDVVQAIVQVLAEPRAGVFNLGSADVLPIRELVQLVLGEAGGRQVPEVQFGTIAKKDAGMQFLALDATKATQDLNWKPSVHLQQGIREYFSN